MRRHHKRGTARFGCLRRFCLSTHSESFGVIRWPECDCVCAGVGLSGGRGRLLTHVHRASACTLNAVGLLPVSGRGDARVAPPCPTTLCVWRRLPYLTLPAPSLWRGAGGLEGTHAGGRWGPMARRRRRFFGFFWRFFTSFHGNSAYLRPCYHALRQPVGAADRAMMHN